MFKKVMLLVLFIMMFTSVAVHAQDYGDGCVIPASGPWPACATGGNPAPTPTPGGSGCVIPESGPWPPCARGGGNPAPTPTPTPGGSCVIPASGPWPPCAKGGGNPSPTPTPWPTQTPQQPQVREFTVGTNRLAWGGTTTIHWAVDNIDEIWLSVQSPTGNGFTSRRSATGWHDLTVEGACMTGLLKITLSTTHEFEQTRLAQKELQISGTEWFWESPQITPDQEVGCLPAQSVQLAHQQFEHGEMFWVPHPDGTPRLDAIFVLFDEPQNSGRDWLEFRDNYSAGDPEPTGYTPPAGMSQPKRGFGKIWHEQPWVRQSLGWATDSERGYQGLMQGSGDSDFESRTTTGETYISSPDNSHVYQLHNRITDGNAVHRWAFASATIR